MAANSNASLAMDVNMTSAVTTTTPSPMEIFEMTHGQLFDFRKMAVVDWDEMPRDGQLTPRPYTIWNALYMARLALAAWILAAHLAIVVFVLAKRALRVQPKNLLIINVALANMLMGGGVVPLKLHFVLDPESVNCDLAVGWMFVSDYYQSCVSVLAVFCLVLERFVYVYTEKKQKNVPFCCTSLGTILLLLLPWFGAAAMLVPTFLAGLLARSVTSGSCLFKVNDSYFLASQLLAFVPASLGVFILAPCTGLLDCLRPKRCFYTPVTPRGESMTVTTIVTLFSIICEVPWCVVRLLMMRMECNSPDCVSLSEGLTLAMWLRLAKAAVFPFIWLAYTDIRDAMKCKVDCDLLCGDWEEDTDDEDRKIEETDQGYPLTMRS